MAIVEFTLPERFKTDDAGVRDVASKIAAIIYRGEKLDNSPPEKKDNGSWHICPQANDWWLTPPRTSFFLGRPLSPWVLQGRYASKEDAEAIVTQLFLVV